MRHDMYKIIVERPRTGAGHARSRPAPDDLEDSPRQEGLRRRHRQRKWLNENLRPLERFLASQVGRPWNKVYAEICAGIDRRNTVQQHIHQHLADFVATQVFTIDGALHADQGWRGRQPIATSAGPRFYVDPHSGLLRENRGRVEARRAWMAEHRRRLRDRRDGRREDRRILDATTQLHRIGGVWYRVALAGIRGNGDAIDALRHIAVSKCPRRDDHKHMRGNFSLFDNADVYAHGKRQLSARELREYGLVNDRT